MDRAAWRTPRPRLAGSHRRRENRISPKGDGSAMHRKTRNSRPCLESLESRQLLSGTTSKGLFLPNGYPINEADHARLAGRLRNEGLDPLNLKPEEAKYTWKDRRKFFELPTGQTAAITLYGQGTLEGTELVDDAINIIYNNTSDGSRIIGRVSGRGGPVPVRAVIDADSLKEGDLLSIGGNALGVINLPQFDLIDNGVIVMAGGENPIIHLNSVGANTLINVYAQFPDDAASSPAPATAVIPTATFLSNGEFAGVGGLTVPGAVGETTTPVDTGGFRTIDLGIGQTQLITSNAGGIQVPQNAGAKLVFNTIDGDGGTLGNPRIFGYDPNTNTLLGFNISTQKQVIPNSEDEPVDTLVGDLVVSATLPGASVEDVGLGLGRVTGIGEVILVGKGTDVWVYQYTAPTMGGPAESLTLIGGFTILNLETDYPDQKDLLKNFKKVDGIGTSGLEDFLVDSTGGATIDGNPQGQAILIDVTQSFNAGKVVLSNTETPANSVFTPGSNFLLASGATGVPGRTQAFLTGGQRTDPFNPMNYFSRFLAEPTRPSFSGTPRTSSGTTAFNTTNRTPEAMGSLNQLLAVPVPDAAGIATIAIEQPDGTSVDVNTRTVTLISPDTFTPVSTGSLYLETTAELTGLSEVYYPEVGASAVINVLGLSFLLQAKNATGLVYNNLGYTDLIQINRVEDSTFVALPIGHVDIDQRVGDVTILSTPNRETDRNGVTLVPNLRAIGPIVPPGPLLQPSATVLSRELPTRRRR